jgi:hypothetical protein
MTLEFQPIEIHDQSDTDGRLVLHDGKLVAILARLSGDHAENAGRWFMECGFGSLSRKEEHFADLDAAESWINQQLG